MKIPEELKWKNTGRTIGEGGQARVYEVVDRAAPDGPRYALKVVSAGRPPKVYERFYREIAAIKALNHPSVVRIFDHSQEGASFHFYVMELVEGATTLDKLMQSNANPFLRDALAAVDLFISIADALVACEAQKPRIVHRDLSPYNILVAPDRSIRIIDFGICQIDGETPITLSDEGVGTPNYMSPECESGSEGEIDVCSDLYSAGKILWSAITGKRAFARENPAFTSRSMTTTFPENPETWHLHHIFEHTIRHDRTKRWRSANDAVYWGRRVRQLITGGYVPLEILHKQCPICGIGGIGDMEQGHCVFGNPNPRGVRSCKCGYCGYCFPIDVQQIDKLLNERKSMQ